MENLGAAVAYLSSEQFLEDLATTDSTGPQPL